MGEILKSRGWGVVLCTQTYLTVTHDLKEAKNTLIDSIPLIATSRREGGREGGVSQCPDVDRAQSCFSISLPARQAASWRRCLSKFASFHTHSATLLVWPTLAMGQSLPDNGTSRIYPLANIAKNGNSRKFTLANLTDSTVCALFPYICQGLPH